MFVGYRRCNPIRIAQFALSLIGHFIILIGHLSIFSTNHPQFLKVISNSQMLRLSFQRVVPFVVPPSSFPGHQRWGDLHLLCSLAKLGVCKDQG